MIAYPHKKNVKKSKMRIPKIIRNSARPAPEPVQDEGVEVRVPKTTGVQDAMVALEMAIQDNIVGLTHELAQQHLKYHLNKQTGITVVSYKDKPVLRCGMRASMIGSTPEFYIESMGAVSA